MYPKTTPISLVILTLILILFLKMEWSLLHLLYIYPIVFWLFQFALGLLFTPSVKGDDKYFDAALQIVPNKTSQEDLVELLAGYEFIGAQSLKTLSKSNDPMAWSLNADIHKLFELDFAGTCLQNVKIACYFGHFRGQAILLSAYYIDRDPALLGFLYKFDMESHKGKMLDVYLTAMLSVFKEFLSNYYGNPVKIDDRTIWENGSITAVYIPTSGALYGVIFDRSILNTRTALSDERPQPFIENKKEFSE